MKTVQSQQHNSFTRVQIMKGIKLSSNDRVFRIWMCCGLLAMGCVVAAFWAFDLRDAPAWIQAVGSIAAVAAALLVANAQTRETTKARRTRDEVIFRLVRSVAAKAAKATMHLFQSFETLHSGDRAARAQLLSDFEQQLFIVRGIDPIELPMAEMVEPFLNMRGAMEQSIVLAKLLAEDGLIDRLACATTLSISSQVVNCEAERLFALKLD
ncbi:hypothetical protein A1395_30645 [Pseudomonas protegens]|nr:hypothetical protein A1395_30645 [Pseudomonas protegens]